MIRNKITIAILVLNIIILLVAGYLMFYPVKLTEINDPYPVYPTDVSPGDTIYYTIDFEKFSEYRVTSITTLICDSGYFKTISSGVSEAPIGHYIYESSQVIPDDAPKGECYYQFSSDAQINPLRTEAIDSRTHNFNVI